MNDQSGRQVTPVEPYIPHTTSLPEITIKAILLGVGLSILLAGANAYLGLLAGMTRSAAVPAAVVSRAVLRMFRRSNILENNIVQTAASAGESLAAGVIFTFPAMIILGVWTDFNYWQTTTIAALGGVTDCFGVLLHLDVDVMLNLILFSRQSAFGYVQNVFAFPRRHHRLGSHGRKQPVQAAQRIFTDGATEKFKLAKPSPQWWSHFGVQLFEA